MAVSWVPTVQEVHNEIPQRGIPPDGFTASTVPTAGQVEQIAVEVTVDVVGAVGAFDPTYVVDDQVTLGDLARRAAALGAASKVEDAFYPEQQTGDYMGVGSTPSQHLYARYQRALERLQAHVAAWRRGGAPPGGTISTVPGMVRMGRPNSVVASRW
jgi:hypothetical protein